MQDTILAAVAQTCPQKSMPSLTMLQESIQSRLEQFTFSSHTPLELYQHNDPEEVSDYLEVTVIELQHLINELKWLKWIQQYLQG